MKCYSSALIEFPGTAHSSVKIATEHIEETSVRPNNLRLDDFSVRFAWVFASTVALLLAVSLLLAVAGYAGSTLDSAAHTKTPSAGTR